MIHSAIITAAIAVTLISTQAQAGRYVNAISQAAGLQGRVLWCDSDANLFNLDTRDKVAAIVDHCKKANINIVVLDAKMVSGLVTYSSRFAPHVKESQGKPYPQDYDVLRAMTEECHRAGIEVYASINTFSEGTLKDGKQIGLAFDNPDWQCVKYQTDRWLRASDGTSYPVDGTNCAPVPGRLNLITDPKSLPRQLPDGSICISVDSTGIIASSNAAPCACPAIPDGGYILIASGPAGDWLKPFAVGSKLTLESRPRFVQMGSSPDEHNAVFVNPANPQVQAHELSVVREIIRDYNVDGIVFDRMRYPGIDADFSDFSRSTFERWLGKSVERFPEDIYAVDPIPDRPIIRGKYFGKWMEWRASVIRGFLAEARKQAKAIKPQAKVVAYVGSWYGSYYNVGVNWASPSHQPPYDWAGPDYKKTGYADLLDWITTGCYAPYPTDEDARAAGTDWSVASAGRESSNTVEDDTFVYGGIYLLLFDKNDAALERAIKAAASSTQGVMFFDLCYIVDNPNWWDVIERALAKPARAPHTIPGLIDKAKEVRQFIETNTAK